MHDEHLSIWAARFSAAACATLGSGGPPGPDGFVDEAGHHRQVDRPLLRWIRGESEAPPASSGWTPDVGLWWALHEPRIDVDRLVQGSDGPLIARAGVAADSIEVYTECELAAIHALWNLAELRGRATWRARCLGAAAWVIENLQPDNATGHPWGAHVFAIGARCGLGPESDLLAQTLLHNSMVNFGRPDRFAACVLWDCARACRVEAGR